MTKKVFRVIPWVTYPDGTEVIPTVRVTAETSTEATKKVKKWYKKSPQPVESITFLSSNEIQNLEDYALDLLWQTNPNLYLRLWEPDITTKAMLTKLKKASPALWEGLINW